MPNTTILLVEDEAELSMLYRDLFILEGFTILEAYDGNQAIEVYTRSHRGIDLVLMDIGLPLLDGKEVFKMLKKINPDVKVVFISGYLDEQLATELLQAGAKALIRKPHSPEMVINNVRGLLAENSA